MRACPHPLPSVVAKGIHSEEDQKTIRWIVFPTNDGLLEAASDLPAAARPAVDILAAQLRKTREKIEVVTARIEAAQKTDPLARRLATIQVVIAVTASAIAASRRRRASRTTPEVDTFRSAHDYAAGPGLTPQPHSNAAVADWLEARLKAGVRPGEIGVIVRTVDQFPCASEAIEAAGQEPEILTGTAEPTAMRIALRTMHVAKGFEFRAVAVMACDVVPLEARISAATDEGTLREIFNTERHLLYVACIRVRDDLHVSGVEPASEFLEDLIEA